MRVKFKKDVTLSLFVEATFSNLLKNADCKEDYEDFKDKELIVTENLDNSNYDYNVESNIVVWGYSQANFNLLFEEIKG